MKSTYKLFRCNREGVLHEKPAIEIDAVDNQSAIESAIQHTGCGSYFLYHVTYPVRETQCMSGVQAFLNGKQNDWMDTWEAAMR